MPAKMLLRSDSCGPRAAALEDPTVDSATEARPGRGPDRRGRFDEAVGQFQLALRLSPVDPRAFLAYSGVASSHFLSGRYQEALEWAADGIRRWPLFVQLHRQRMAALAMLGRLEEAARSREEVLRLDAALTISEMKRSSPYRPEDLERMVAAWRLGGMPE
jgi:tetratricopeptide (TPR) repeat protein